MSLINIVNLTFCYEGSYDNIFENVSFQIDTDWKLGFTGKNGRGKTTFLNLLLGKYDYNGQINSNVDFEYFPYNIEDKSRNTIDILFETAGNCQLWELESELSKLNVDEDVLYRPFKTLSNGEQTKALLAALFLRENSFLLIDEPTNHLDAEARAIVSRYLNTKKGFILVSHDRNFLDSCIDHILSINKTDIEIQSGNFSSWYYNKQLADNLEIEKNVKLKKEIKRLTQTAREKAEWSDTAERRKIGFDPSKVEKSMGRRAFEGAKSKKMMSRSKALEGRQASLIAEKSKLLKNIEEASSLKITQVPYHSKKLLDLVNVSLFYDNKTVCDNLSFMLEQSDRLALCGKNGSGKSSIIKLICGEDISYTGSFYKGNNLKISYVPQDSSFLTGSLNDYANPKKIDQSLFKTILSKLDFSQAQFEKDMSLYSAGQKKKVLIAASLCEKANLYIWDEPLNYIDVLSRIQIEELLLEYQTTIIFVEHDKAFCDNIATKYVYL